MFKNNNYKNIFINKPKKRKFNLLKSLSLILCLLCLLLLGNFALNYKYSNITNRFFSEFNESQFDSAKSTLDNKWLSLKKKDLNKDLESYFTDIVALVCSGLEKNEITSSRALDVLSEIKDYDVLNSSLDDLITHIDNDSTLSSDETTENNINDETSTYSNEDLDNYFNSGLNFYNSKDYSNAYKNFNIYISNSSSESNIAIASSYMDKIKSEYKDDLLLEAEELLANKYYTNSIDLLSEYDTNILGDYDIDIYNKISSIEMFREEYSGDIYTSSAILESITLDNVNTFGIESQTDYLIYVNLKDQLTYVYQGFSNDWNLVNTFISSTGVSGKETPKGIFAVTNRGDWFFSEEFDQGAKYWVQFMGDYLFHSVPFDEGQETILDNTLGLPASHGCVRLSIEDAKWLYDNIPNNTKIIIN